MADDIGRMFAASLAAEAAIPDRSRTRTHKWQRGTFADLEAQVPGGFEFGPFVDAETGNENERKRAVIHRPTGKPIAAMTERYSLLDHKVLVQKIREGLTNGERPDGYPAEMYRDDLGVRFGFRVLLPGVKFTGPDGTEYCGRIETKNAVDGSMSYSFLAGVWRKICGNGAGIWIAASRVTRMHTSQLDTLDIKGFVRDSVAGIAGFGETLTMWASTKITDERMPLVELEVRDAFGTAGKRMIEVFKTDRDDRMPGSVPGMTGERTAYRLWNAMTWVTSRQRDLQSQVQMDGKIRPVMDSLFAAAA